jgi:hypothetical protein
MKEKQDRDREMIRRTSFVTFSTQDLKIKELGGKANG